MVWVVIGSQELKQASWISDAWTARSEARVTHGNGLGRRKEKGERTALQARWRNGDRTVGHYQPTLCNFSK